MAAYFQFGELQLDVLKEIGNIGAAHAATALSQLLEKPIDMMVPKVRIVSFDEIADSVGGAEQVVAAVFFRVTGDAPSSMFFIMELDSVRKLLNRIVGVPDPDGQEYSELELSALNEVGNILAGSYLSSLADFTKLDMHPTVPMLAIDMAGAILGYGLLPYGQYGDQALMIDTMFAEGNEQLKGYFFLLPDMESFAKIFAALGVPPE